MTQEQKAKKYDEALEWMRKVYPTLTGADKEDAEHYFPELQESDDERIRKAILSFIKQPAGMQELTTKEYSKWVEYLEKQKVITEGDFGRGYDCGYQAGYASKEQKPQNTKPEINFASDYSKMVWEKLMSKFSAIEGYQIGANEVSDIVLNAILNAFKWQQEQKPEAKLTGWVARDGDGDIYVYGDYPEKDSKKQFWFGMGSSSRILDQKSFPDLKWENGPVEVELTIKRK